MLFRTTPKPFVRWRLFLLRLFGCKISGRPFVAPSAIIRMPWQLALEDRATLGAGAEVYNLGFVRLGARCTVAQQAYLCGGTHDLEDPSLPLVTGQIVIGEDCFIGVRALVLPGVNIGDGAVIGAGSVVARDLPAWTVYAGNPCRPLRPRAWREIGSHADG
jgi:putative colanic acid biosynthesis acetyltransferase WcaF